MMMKSISRLSYIKYYNLNFHLPKKKKMIKNYNITLMVSRFTRMSLYFYGSGGREEGVDMLVASSRRYILLNKLMCLYQKL
jgi:hypothetical protein